MNFSIVCINYMLSQLFEYMMDGQEKGNNNMVVHKSVWQYKNKLFCMSLLPHGYDFTFMIS